MIVSHFIPYRFTYTFSVHKSKSISRFHPRHKIFFEMRKLSIFHLYLFKPHNTALCCFDYDAHTASRAQSNIREMPRCLSARNARPHAYLSTRRHISCTQISSFSRQQNTSLHSMLLCQSHIVSIRLIRSTSCVFADDLRVIIYAFH